MMGIFIIIAWVIIWLVTLVKLQFSFHDEIMDIRSIKYKTGLELYFDCFHE